MRLNQIITSLLETDMYKFSMGQVIYHQFPGYKTPSDGLCGKTDEDNLGFSYDVLDEYIRTGHIEDMEIKARIDHLHERNLFKLQPMASFPYN